MTRAQRRTGLVVGVVAVLSTVAFVGAPAASASPSTILKATNKCWLQVVNDWLEHGTVENLYAIPCYTQAVTHLSAYPDIKQYSSAIDDINRAKLNAIQEERGNASGGNLPGSNGNSAGGGIIPGGGGNTPSGGAGAPHKSFFSRLASDIGPGNAQSIPLPLLVLGGLAVLLLLTAAATWLARRLQARRVTPAPAVAKRR